MIKIKNRHRVGRARGTLIAILSLMVLMVIAYQGDVFSQANPGSTDGTLTIAQYTAFPPFGGRMIKPNVLINLDTSQSQYYFAYDWNYNARTVSGGKSAVPPSVGFDPNKTYYGYFRTDKWYKYDSTIGEFVPVGDKSASRPADSWDGNFLNWLTMRRVDVIKKVLIGGKTKERVGISAGHPHDLIGQAAHMWTQGYQKQLGVPEDGNLDPSLYTPYASTDAPVTFTFDNTDMRRVAVTDIAYFTTDADNITYQVVVHPTPYSEPEGVIQRVGSNVRWGLEFIDDGTLDEDSIVGNREECKGETGNSGSSTFIDVDGGTVVVPVGYNNIEDTATEEGIETRIAKMLPNTPGTPLAESLWTATGYFAQDPTTGATGPRYSSNSYATGSYEVSDAVDPYNYASDPANDPPVWVPCARSYVITITDGEPTVDLDVTQTPAGPAGDNVTYADDTTPVPPWADTTSTNADH